MREIVRAEAWKGLRELIGSLGGDSDAIFAAAHVDIDALAFPDRYLPLRTLIDAVEIAAQRTGRPDFGLLNGSQVNTSVMGALSIAALNAPTGREGLAVVARYMHIHNPALKTTVTAIPRTTRDFVGIAIDIRSARPACQYLERNIAALHRGLGKLCGKDYRPIEVWIPHLPIAAPAAYRKIFGVTPRFGKPSAGILIEKKTLDTFQPGRSARLRELAEIYLRTQNRKQDDSFAVEVTNMTRGLLSTGDCSPEQIARARHSRAHAAAPSQGRRRHLREDQGRPAPRDRRIFARATECAAVAHRLHTRLHRTIRPLPQLPPLVRRSPRRRAPPPR